MKTGIALGVSLAVLTTSATAGASWTGQKGTVTASIRMATPIQLHVRATKQHPGSSLHFALRLGTCTSHRATVLNVNTKVNGGGTAEFKVSLTKKQTGQLRFPAVLTLGTLCMTFSRMPALVAASTATPSPTANPTSRDFEVLFSELLAAKQTSKPAGVQPLYWVYSPTVNRTSASDLIRGYEEAMKFWSQFNVSPVAVTFLLMSEKDRDWWLQQLALMDSSSARDWWDSGHCPISASVHCGYGSSPKQDGSFHFGQILGSNHGWVRSDWSIAYHEATHLYQMLLLGDRMSALPSWFAEGQATLMQYAFAAPFVTPAQDRLNQLEPTKKTLPELAAYTPAQWASFFARMEADFDFTFSNRLGYSIGELICEKLYMDFGIQSVHDWLRAIKVGWDYETAFALVMDTSYESWMNRNAAQYLASHYASGSITMTTSKDSPLPIRNPVTIPPLPSRSPEPVPSSPAATPTPEQLANTPSDAPTPAISEEWKDPREGTECGIKGERIPNQIFELVCLPRAEFDPNSLDTVLRWWQNHKPLAS